MVTRAHASPSSSGCQQCLVLKGTVTGRQELHSSNPSAGGREGMVRLGTLGCRELESPMRKPTIAWGRDRKESLP